MIELTQEKREELANYARARLASHVVHGGCSDEEEIFKIALTSLTAGPVLHAVDSDVEDKLYTVLCNEHEDGSYPLFTAPPVPEIIDIESDVKNIIQLLSGREWAEHCTSTELGKELESQITDLYNEVSKIKLPDRDKLPGWARNHEDSLDWYESEIKRLNGLGE